MKRWQWSLRVQMQIFLVVVLTLSGVVPASAFTWSSQTSGISPTTDLKSVIFDPSGAQFLAVGGGGTIVSSLDGQHWSGPAAGTNTNFTSTDLTAIAYGNTSSYGTNPGYSASSYKFAVAGAGVLELAPTYPGTWVSSAISGVSFNAITFGRSYTSVKYMAVGNGGKVYVHTGASSLTYWPSKTISIGGSPVTTNLYGVASGLIQGTSGFVVVGDGGRIFTENNNTTSWVERTSPVATRLNGVAYYRQDASSGLFVAVGDGGTILTSADGATWSPQASGTTENLYGVSFGTVNGSFYYVAVGSHGTILTSQDAVTWSTESQTGTTSDLRSVAAGNNRFVAVGLAGSAVFVPGTNAALRQLSLSDLLVPLSFDSTVYSYTATVTNSVYSTLVTATPQDSSATVTVNGKDPSLPVPLDIGRNSIQIQVTAQDGLTTATYTVNVTRLGEVSSNANLASLTIRDATGSGSDTYPLTVSGNTYSATVPYNTYRISVTPIAASSAATVMVNKTMVANGGSSDPIDLAVGVNHISVDVTAEDQTTRQSWTIDVTRLAADPSDATLQTIRLSSGTLSPAFSPEVTAYTASVGYDTDSVAITVQAAVYDAGLTINGQTIRSGETSSAIALHYGENPIPIVVTSLNHTLSTYTITITRQDPGKGILKSVVSDGNGQIVAVGSDRDVSPSGVVRLTTDGVHWTEQKAGTTPSLGTTSLLNGIAYGKGMYVAVGNLGYPAYNLLVSRNLNENWSGYRPSSRELFNIAYSEATGIFVAVGEGGTVLRYEPDTNKTTVFNNLVQYTAKINGVPVLTNVSGQLNGIVYGDGKWVAVGEGGSIIYSPDLTAFAKGAVPSGTTNLNGVAYGNGQYVAVGDDGGILSSPDAVNWSKQVSGVTSSLRGIHYENGQFLAVGDSGTFLVSKDGQLWLSVNGTNPDSNYRDIAPLGDRYVVVGAPGVTDLLGPDLTYKTMKDQLEAYIAKAMEIYQSSVEGYSPGQAPPGTRETLLSAIESAQRVRDSEPSHDLFADQRSINTAASMLDAAIRTFQSHLITRYTGDLNRNGRVSLGDLGMTSGLFGLNADSTSGSLVASSDFNGDGRIDSFDLGFMRQLMMNHQAESTTYAPLPASQTTQDVPFTQALPQGPAEFEVQRPAEAQAEAIKYAATDPAFAIKMDPSADDNYQALVSALAYMKTNYSDKGIPSKLVLAPGTYKVKLGLANGANPQKLLQLTGFSDFTLDGSGAVLEFSYAYGNAYKQSSNLYLTNNNRIAVDNLTIDWDWTEYPLDSLLEVVGVGKDMESVTFKVHDFNEARKRQLSDSSLTNDFLVFDPERGSVGAEWVNQLDITNDATFRKINMFDPSKDEWSGDTVTLFAKPGSSDSLKKWIREGAQFVVRHYVYDTHGINMYSNTNVTLDGVTIYSAPGMGIIIGGKQEYTEMNHVHIAMKPGSYGTRYSSVVADGVHIQQSLGHFKFENSSIEDNLDDNMNIHDNIRQGVSFVGGSQQLTLPSFSGVTPMSVGDEVELLMPDAKPFDPPFTAKIVSFANGVMTLDTPLPTDVQADQSKLLLVNRSYHSNNYIIRNNLFRGNKGRGLIAQQSDGLIENNTFFGQRKTALCLDMEIGASWREGYGVHNVVVRGNIFENNNTETVWLPHRQSPVIRIGSFSGDQASESDELTWGVQHDILIQDNTIKAYPGVALQITGSDRITVQGNRFQNFTREPVDSSKYQGSTVALEGRRYNGAIFVYYGKHLNILGNTWYDSPLLQHTGVFYNTDLVDRSDIAMNGNRVSESGADPEHVEFKKSLQGLTPDKDYQLRVVFQTDVDGGIYQLEDSAGLLDKHQNLTVDTYSDKSGLLVREFKLHTPASTEENVRFSLIEVGKNKKSTGYKLLRYDPVIGNLNIPFSMDILDKHASIPWEVGSNALIRLNGVAIERNDAQYDSYSHSYLVRYPAGTTKIPHIDVIPNDSKLHVDITKPTALPGDAAIRIYDDAGHERSYTLHFVEAVTGNLTTADPFVSGQDMVVNVGLKGVQESETGFTAMDASVVYDPQVLEYEGMEAADGSLEAKEATATQAPGQVEAIVTALGSEHAITTDSNVLKLKFRIKRDDLPTAVNVASLKLSDASGVEFNGYSTPLPLRGKALEAEDQQSTDEK